MPDNDSLLVDKLADDLRARIEGGEYGTSGTLPSTTELSKQWQKPRNIVTQVMLLLRSEGHIRVVGNRYVVNHPRLILPGLTKNFEKWLVDQGFDAVIENVIEPRLEAMPAEIATLFDQSSGIHTVHRIRKQGIPNLPLRIGEIWYPAKLAEPFLKEMQTNGKMDVVGAIKREYGIYIVNVKEDITARIPSKEEIKLLSIARYQPVFEVRRSSFAQDGQPVMFTRTIMVATNFILSREYPVDHWK